MVQGIAGGFRNGRIGNAGKKCVREAVDQRNAVTAMRREGYNSVTKLRLRKSAFDNARRAVKSSSSSFSSSIYQGFRGRGRERGRRMLSEEPVYRAEISSIRSMGSRARFKISAGSSMRGRVFSCSRAPFPACSTSCTCTRCNGSCPTASASRRTPART